MFTSCIKICSELGNPAAPPGNFNAHLLSTLMFCRLWTQSPWTRTIKWNPIIEIESNFGWGFEYIE